MSIITLTKDNFKAEVLESKTPVVVDFMAKWCAPCKMMDPIIEETAKELDGVGVKIARLDVDLEPDIAQRYQIMSVPTILSFKSGKVVEQIVGTKTKKELLAKFTALVGA